MRSRSSGVETGFVQRLSCRDDRERSGAVFRADDAALFDAGAGRNPMSEVSTIRSRSALLRTRSGSHAQPVIAAWRKVVHVPHCARNDPCPASRLLLTCGYQDVARNGRIAQ